jgi:3-hydroxyacyl-[acyl-carrier-protein] dehydratase
MDAQNSLGYQTILDALPHRYPFLLVDQILEITDESISGIKNVSFNEPIFQGHFPEDPIFPGVLLVEALAQLSGIYLSLKHDAEKSNQKQGLFAGIENFSFKKIIRPGSQIVLKSTFYKSKMSVYLFNVTAMIDHLLVGDGQIKIIYSDKK